MLRTILALTTLTLLFALIACGPAESEPAETPASPAEADAQPDPTVVDPDHYKTEFENDQVRVLRITYGPDEASVMHYHPDSVAVYLTDIQVEMGLPDGTNAVSSEEAGKHSFAPAGNHLPKNLGGPVEVILIELKSDGQGTAGEGGADPTEVDADHYTAEFENDRVRILRIAYEAGDTSTMHYHPDSVAVFLTDHKVSFEAPDGSTQQVEAKAGEHIFSEGGLHLPTNLAEQTLEVILVELK